MFRETTGTLGETVYEQNTGASYTRPTTNGSLSGRRGSASHPEMCILNSRIIQTQDTGSDKYAKRKWNSVTQIH